MQIWVDADACPKLIKEILYRAANRTTLILVANQPLIIPGSEFIKKVLVTGGFDVADNYIVDNMQEGDLVITADIPLADGVVNKNGTALNPRGELYTKTNIKQRLAVRNFSEVLRSTGVLTGGPPTLSKKDIQTFSNCLDRFLTQKKGNG